MRVWLLLIFSALGLMSFSSLQSQNRTIKGTIIDVKTSKPLPFVNISILGTIRGTTSDLSGTFRLAGVNRGDSIVFSYVGYEKLKMAADWSDTVVKMTPTSRKLAEVVILPGKNPADSIMALAARKRKSNNPRNIPEYVYEMYNKTVITMADSIIEKLMASRDTSNQKFGKHLKNHELFVTETYTQNAYKKQGRIREDIVANRVSGLKNPGFYFLSTLVQPFSFYEDYIELSGKRHVSPLARNADKDYLFILSDTLYRDHDTVFVIRFGPKSKRKFAALKGVISINTDNYAVENVLAQSALDEKTPLEINQRYKRVNGKWFPEQLNFTIEFKDLDFADQGAGIIMEGRSYVNNVAFDTTLRRRDFSAVTTRFEKDANRKTEEEWGALRQSDLSDKESRAYVYVDSAGEAAGLDQKMTIMESVIRESVPIKFLDLDLNSIVNFNEYEGFRLGAGLYTNHRLSRVVSGGGYFAYGFRDYTTKYGGRLDVTLNQLHDVKLRGYFQNDVFAPGASGFERERPSLFNSDFAPFFYNWMNNEERYGAEFTMPLLRYGRFKAFADWRTVDFTRDFRMLQIEPGGDAVSTIRTYNTAEVGFNYRYSFGEEKAELFNTAVTVKTPNPVFDVGYTFGAGDFPEAYGSEYHKVRARITHRRLSQKLKRTQFHLEGAYIHGDVPLTEQHTLRTAYEPGLPVYGHSTFQTVRFGEFYSDLNVQFFIQHELIKFKTNSKVFSPSLTLFQAAGWGVNVNDERPLELGRFTRTPEHGLFETGFLIENIYKSSPDSFIPAGYGLGFYYRYGAYNEGPFLDNFAIKLVLSQL